MLFKLPSNQYFGHLMLTATRKDHDAGKDWRQKEKRVAEDEIDSINNSMNKNLRKFQEIVKDGEAWLQFMRSQRVGHKLATEQHKAIN